MSDRYNYLTVALEANLKDEDAEGLIKAIEQFRGVLEVKPHVADADSYIADARAKHELRQKLWESLFYEKPKS